MRFVFLLASLNILTSTSFVLPTSRSKSSTSRVYSSSSSAEEALREYMIKAQADKLKAIKEAEDKSVATIKALQQEIQALKEKSTAQQQAPPPVLTNKLLTDKLGAYQKFISSYIIKAQEEKIKAVAAAEAKIQLKYETLLLSAGAAPPVSATPLVLDTSLYDKRSAKVAAAAGKSRWGSMEVERSSQGKELPNVVSSSKTSTAAPVTAPSTPSPKSTSTDTIPAEVVAADHGMRADGGVGGLSLAERVLQGSSATTTNNNLAKKESPPTAVKHSLYDLRNQKVAVMSGKSRWGSMEIEKATQLSSQLLLSNTTGSSTSNDKPKNVSQTKTLEQRINLGASLVGNVVN